MQRKPFPKSFVAELDDGTRVEFYQRSHPEGTIPPSFVLEVRGPGQERQDEFVGSIKFEVCAHGDRDHFRRFLTLAAEDAKPLEIKTEGYSCKIGGAIFCPSERTSYKITIGSDISHPMFQLPAYALRTMCLEMVERKPQGELDM